MNPLNIIYIHSHDTGRYLQPYGHAVPTPHIQQLAEQGVLFRKAFCAAPTCSPSRAALLTGRWPHASGMLGLAHRGFRLTDPSQHLAATLGRAGYRACLAGVQHESKDPTLQGYEVLTTNHQEAADAASAFLSSGPGAEPFFLSVGFFETHRTAGGEGNHNHTPQPLGDPRYCAVPAPLPDTPAVRQDFADYLVSAKRLDERVGQVMAALRAAGLEENTLVISTTDHGLAFPGMKCSLTDHGIGVALILRGPRGFSGGRVIDAMVSHVDVFPTIAELIGLARPAWLDGVSVLPLVQGTADRIRDELFAEVTFHAAYEPMRAVRTERFKLIRRFDPTPIVTQPNCDESLSKSLLRQFGWASRATASEELFDLIFDPCESHDVSGNGSYSAALAEMRGRLDRWMHATNDPLCLGPVAPPSGTLVNRSTDASPGLPPVQH